MLNIFLLLRADNHFGRIKYSRITFYFNFKVFYVKINFILQFLESIISEKSHLLEKHRETDIGQIEKVSVVRDIKTFMKTNDFHIMNFFPLIHIKKDNIYV